MDIQKEREAFQNFCEQNFDVERHEQTYFDEQTQSYENDLGECTESINMAWSAWQAKAQAVPEGHIVSHINAEYMKAGMSPPLPKFRDNMATYDEANVTKMANRIRTGAVLLARLLDEKMKIKEEPHQIKKASK